MKLNRVNLKNILLLPVIAGLCSCAGAVIAFQSAPDKTQVFARSVGAGGEMLPLGETPLTISTAELQKKVGGVGPVLVEFRKNGYLSSKLFVTDLASTDVTVNTELRPSNGLEDMQKLNGMIDRMFESQRLARAGRTEEALKSLGELKKTFPEVSSIYQLEGGIYYLEKKYKEALDSYGLAIKYDPKNMASIRIHEHLESILGTKKDPPVDAGNKGASP